MELIKIKLLAKIYGNHHQSHDGSYAIRATRAVARSGATGSHVNISHCQIGLQQEALLPQTDRATRYISRNLVNCCSTVETSCTANPQQIKVMELEGYS